MSIRVKIDVSTGRGLLRLELLRREGYRIIREGKRYIILARRV